MIRDAKWIIAAALSSVMGCGPGEKPGPATAPVVAPAAPARLDGAVRFDDQWLKVGPFVGHQAKMDLLTQCLTRRDDEEAKGETPQPLCVDRAKRDSRDIKVLRVEGGFETMRDTVGALRTKNESAHVFVEKGGSVYQVLDFVYAPRRDGEYRRDEIRFIAAGEGGLERLEPLITEMTRLYPGIQVIRVEKKP